MRKTWTAIALLAGASATGAAPPEPSPDAVEPPLELRLEGLGKEPLPVRLDQPFELPAGPARRVVLRAAPTRLFERGGLRFRYPNAFVFAFEIDDQDRSWALSGDDAKIILFAESMPSTYVADYAKAIAQEYAAGGEAPAPAPVVLRLGPREVGGLRVEGKTPSQVVRHDVVAFQAGGSTWTLVVQDSPAEDGAPSAEASAVTALLAETFEIR